MLPQWMKMAKDPSSVGAQFLNAFGLEIHDIEMYLEQIWNNMHIGTANLQTADFCYRVPLALRDVVDIANLDVHVSVIIEGERVDCMPVDTLRLFFEAEDNVYMVDTDEGYVYIKATENLMEKNVFKPFDAIDIGSAVHYEYMLHHIWNIFDEFGMLLGIQRLPGERNKALKDRILDVFVNPGGAHKQGLINGISRELGLTKEEVSVGALTDEAYVSSKLMNADGTPTETYIRYVNQINNTLGFAWDHMNWGEAYWRSVEENNMGFHYLPHVWDGFSAEWSAKEIQSGIGSGDDLLVKAPKEESSIRNFKAFVGLHGTEERIEKQHPELHFKYKIVAKGKIPNDEYEMEQYRYTVAASEIINLHYTVTAMREFLYRTHISWDERYAYVFSDNKKPGMEIITGETVLHDEEDPYVRLYVDMKTADRTVTPVLEELIVDWTDTNNETHSFILKTDEDFTRYDSIVTTQFLDTESVDNTVTLGKGSFSAVIDTEGAFLKGSAGVSVKVNKTGSISLHLPNT